MMRVKPIKCDIRYGNEATQNRRMKKKKCKCLNKGGKQDEVNEEERRVHEAGGVRQVREAREHYALLLTQQSKGRDVWVSE